ncbi:MAG: response regulator [Deltaproteobacteria bacterium]|nr:response regulator [Deltaproteobacteria bacterium]
MRNNTKTNYEKLASRSSATVLIVDRDTIQVESLCRGMFLYGHECVRISSISEAIDFLNRPDAPVVDLLLTDTTTPGSEGFELIRHARVLHPDLPIIAVCGLNSTQEMEMSEQSGITVLRRPFNPERLDEAIRDLVA